MNRSSPTQGGRIAGSGESISRARRWASRIAAASCRRGLTQSLARYMARIPAFDHSSRVVSDASRLTATISECVPGAVA